MESVTIVLILLLAVVVSGSLSRLLPVSIPAPLVQIGLGALIGLSTNYRVDLEPELFLFLFLPPLLFLDGWRIPKDELFRDISTVVELALGLVLMTVIGMGLFIHWMIPSMPLAVAFALAAVVSPTDPIAVSAIAARVPIPKRMMHILEGESLLNDASGLVCLRFAIAAALTGSFSPTGAAASFLWVAGGGLAIGTAVTLVVTRAKAWISRRLGEETGSQILISLLIPFGCYLLAEHLHASGILAAVAAGVTMSFAEVARQALPVTRMRRNSVWDTIQYALNGIIFVLLGEQLPLILTGAAQTVRTTGHQSPWWLGVYVIAIAAGLALLRFAWVWVSFRLTLLRRGEDRRVPNWRLFAAMSVAGVRGALTLAGVLTLPLALADGTPFPARDLAIFLAAGVIIVSLVAASLVLPLLLKGLTMPPEPSRQAEENEARVAAAEAAIRAIEEAQHAMAEGRNDADLYTAAGNRIMDLYRDRIESRSHEGEAAAEARRQDKIERELRLAGLRAERNAVFALARNRTLGSEIAAKLVRELDFAEVRFRS
ncbi:MULTISPECIES: Na+/H+ antiporter [unclassified Sphingomonas]|uniref:Na+/H+ antiporter n=1 Tax=unclassified Sphingomonas TaxID=196159 RepID=UPI00226AFD71|nr:MULTISPECIES: Na+/H+ antiporter [unclassified Sphingomonas]